MRKGISQDRTNIATSLLAAGFAFSLLAALPGVAGAQYRDGFEGPDVAWKLANADCGVKVVKHQRTLEQAHGDTSSEYLRLVAGQGTHIYYTYDIGRAPLIEESRCSLWLKSDRARLRLLARVVLPRTLDEKTGSPITALLQGDEYTEIGAWQQLHVRELQRLLARQLVVLRRQLGPHVDAGEAYVDLLVINAYGGPGETNVWIDDVEIAGVVEAGDQSSARGHSVSGTPATKPAVLEGRVLLVQNRPTFVRAIEYAGEPLNVLKSLGFNAVWVRQGVTAELNEEARRNELWLIAPVPDLQDNTASPARLDRVITWSVGERLRASDSETVRALLRQLATADPLHRPTLGGVHNGGWSLSRELDLLSFDLPPLLTARTLADSPAQLRAQGAMARVGSPYWAEVALSAPPSLLSQLQRLDGQAPGQLVPDLEQSRSATVAALAGGARGLLFHSARRLDADDDGARQQAAIFRLLNLELSLVEPWFAGSSTPEDVSSAEPNLRITQFQTERSRLVLLRRDAPLAQFVMPHSAAETMTFALPGIPAGDRYFHLCAAGAQPLDRTVGGATSRMVVTDARTQEWVAITQDALVLQHIQRTGDLQRREAVETRLRLAAATLNQAALLGEEIRGLLPPPRDAIPAFREAQRFLQEADQLLVRGDLTSCYRNVLRVEQLTAQGKRLWWDSVRSSFPSPVASPCCVAYETLPSHVRLALRLRGAIWSRNGMPSGDCERLDDMLASGWRQEPGSESAKAAVDICAEQPHGGKSCLRLRCAAMPQGQAYAADPLVSIATPGIRIRAGQIARIHGYVRIAAPLGGAAGRLEIYDNLAGEELAECITHSPVWREFTLYRAAEADGEVVVRFALHGTGEAVIDDVTLEIATPGVSPVGSAEPAGVSAQDWQ